jgi:glycosyltransferase EpsE
MEIKISVLMGIYNCEATLGEAIGAILAQTEPRWELILCDDGSRDDTYAVAESFCRKYPEKIVLLRNEKNMGLNHTLNRCLAAARGEFVARMDGDDLCDPERFARQLAVLEADPALAVVSSAMTYFDESGTWGRCHVKERPVARDFLYGTPFCHGACMVRRQAMVAVGGYTEEDRFLRVEDYDLWVKLYAAGYRGVNLPDALYHMRDDRNAISRRKFRYRLNEAGAIAKAIWLLKLPLWGYIRVLRPILVGLLPTPVYTVLHKKRLGRS